ncbi:protein NATD1-like [Paramacrobiotus metropolitanus]|uniref:protein NATD1-like n=1 Tax=Paramacrobiotus metropolitanus TaxID=2943436 RepID=UPI0024464AD9|nr:protein NATD1-like [Paramacrobiotus metropolitanus]XP_055336471.1 protein NATD1-like [Paramacrobiotus metropolitanus]XP_055336480.1 protein NATD1-like [Paramacrobiotus metropolitanus]XP_055336491.1 protein NATD1-like [Paramacrobiotus metropolitanus]XP_055336498.1 protein NATD1-like [Paramacrobiotus metropolitanus]
MLRGTITRLTNLLELKAWSPTIVSRTMASVQHDERKRKFYIPTGAKDAHLTYELPREGIIDFQHTFVPEDLRGQGIAAKLVDQGLRYAAAENLKVKLTCSYTEDYVNKNRTKISSDPLLGKIEFL